LSSAVRSFRNLLIPDGQVGWLPSALRTAGRIVDTHAIKCVITTGPPFSSHLLGYALKMTRNIPWVADFRDSWTFDPLNDLSGLRLRAERALETLVLRDATHVTCTTEVAADVFRSRSDTEVTVLANGYSREDVPQSSTKSSSGTFRFVHTGSFSASHPLRDPKMLVDAAKDVEEDFEVVFVGHLTDDERRTIQPLEAAGRAIVTGVVPREEAIRWQAEADVLVVVDHPREVLASNVPGKVYEYGAAGKPILAVASSGATRDLLQELGGGVCVPHDLAAIRDAMQSFVTGTDGTVPDPTAWKRYERQEAVRDLATILDRGLG